MTLVAAKVYVDGVAVATFDRIADLPPAPERGLLWIGLVAPDDAELADVARRYDLHPLAVEDALRGDQLAKLEVYDRHLFIVARTAHYEGARIAYGETALFVSDRFLISVRHGSVRDHLAVRQAAEAAPNLLAYGADYVLHAILDHIVDGYFPIVDRIEEQLTELEDKALAVRFNSDDIAALFALRRRVARFARRIEPMEAVASRLATVPTPFIDDNARPYFRDVADHVRRVLQNTTELREHVSSVFETSSLLEAQRQGDTTRKLAAWAAILAVPTAIAGIYGMNFEFMPELRWRLGYPLVLGGMAAICGLLYARFKASRWL